MNQCRSEGEKQPRVSLAPKVNTAFANQSSRFFQKSCRKIHHRGRRDHGGKVVLIRNGAVGDRDMAGTAAT